MYAAPEPANVPVRVPGLIVVDGPIGAGKTTFIEHLANELRQSGARVCVIDEAIPENLEEYYKDPARNVFEFQKAYVLRLFDLWKGLFRDTLPFRKHDFVICDRYWASTRAFARYHRDKGNLSDAQFRELTDIVNLFISLCPVFPEYFVFLDEPDTRCLERIAKRGRPGETDVGDAYMREINEYIRRYNHFPFFGEGEPSKLLEVVDKRAAEHACPRAVLARFAQQTKCIHLGDVVENTTRGHMLPDDHVLDFGAELAKATPLNLSTRAFLMEEATLVATTGKPGYEALDLRSK